MALSAKLVLSCQVEFTETMSKHPVLAGLHSKERTPQPRKSIGASKRAGQAASRWATSLNPTLYFKLETSAEININKEHTMESEMNDKKFVKEFVTKGAKKITDDDVENVVKKADDIKEKFGASGPLARFIEDAQMLIAIVKDYWAGTYRQIPYGSLAAIVFTLAYVFNPLDLIPDVLPVIGQVDDSLVVGACLLLVEQDLYNYKNWKTENDKDKTTAA